MQTEKQHNDQFTEKSTRMREQHRDLLQLDITATTTTTTTTNNHHSTTNGNEENNIKTQL